MADFNEVFAKISQDFRAASGGESSTGYWNLSTTMQEADEILREHIQEITKDQVATIIDKLESGASLSSSEMDCIKLWMVGDADYYVKLENNFEDWKNEVKRLIDEIEKMKSNEPDFKKASHLRALLRDAIRTVGDIVFYIQQKERVANFADASAELDEEERKILIRLLGGKFLSSAE